MPKKPVGKIPISTPASALIELRHLIESATAILKAHDADSARSFELRAEWVIRAIAKFVLLK